MFYDLHINQSQTVYRYLNVKKIRFLTAFEFAIDSDKNMQNVKKKVVLLPFVLFADQNV